MAQILLMRNPAFRSRVAAAAQSIGRCSHSIRVLNGVFPFPMGDKLQRAALSQCNDRKMCRATAVWNTQMYAVMLRIAK